MERRRKLKTLQPNSAHRTIAEWQENYSDPYVITQNIDGFHQRAGSHNVIELHGNIAHNKCIVCGHPYTEVIEDGSLRPPSTYALKYIG